LSDSESQTQIIDRLEVAERLLLLKFARQALEDGVCGRPLSPLYLNELSPRLRQPGASFVTFTSHGELRGCIGALEVSHPLVEDVRLHAVLPPWKISALPSGRRSCLY
jgi:AMMECR1 domain-containing protein